MGQTTLLPAEAAAVTFVALQFGRRDETAQLIEERNEGGKWQKGRPKLVGFVEMV